MLSNSTIANCDTLVTPEVSDDVINMFIDARIVSWLKKISSLLLPFFCFVDSRFLKCAREDENPASRRGYALALGVLPFTVVRKYDTAIIKTLVEGMQIEVWVFFRCNSISEMAPECWAISFHMELYAIIFTLQLIYFGHVFNSGQHFSTLSTRILFKFLWLMFVAIIITFLSFPFFSLFFISGRCRKAWCGDKEKLGNIPPSSFYDTFQPPRWTLR